MTLTSEEKEGGKDLATSNASKRLNHSDHLRSNSAILPSVDETEATAFLGFVTGLSFLAFFSGGSDGDLTGPAPSTGPITETADGSTKDSVPWGLESVSNFFASLFLFFNL